ncbi:FkbM family methyltransferase [Aggregatimonas sangjinii]|uniref:FkbM family methyltransferase n=1 Tax=Aggregatimonas sangjinii TaxID=2583587 RepID=A0A5B7ST53_9FLAO|nr:FkbM family methyltransferase [Aggregatimonas sangjinii]QCX01856.1 FkbM family methyltransferase [Aggregatimonas sangjinii]
MNPKIKAVFLKTFGVKGVNHLRKIKWSILKPFTKDEDLIRDFYKTEVEIPVLEKLLPILISDKKQVLIDIGANIGAYSFYLSKFSEPLGARCIGFEPRKDTFSRLIKNVTAPNFHAEHCACSSENGFADIFLPPSHGQSSLLKMPEFEGIATERITTTTLDDYCLKNKVTNLVFLKIDVEGFEFEVFKGAENTIKENMPIIICESENRHLNVQGKTTQNLIDKVCEMGYSAYVISKSGKDFLPVTQIVIPKNRETADEYYFNYWFVPNSETKVLLPVINDILVKTGT